MVNSFLEDFKNAWNRPNSSLQRLIIINVMVFVFLNLVKLLADAEFFAGFFQNFAMPTSLSITEAGEVAPFIAKPWTFLTSFFTHIGFRHIFWNMIFLYWFGMIIRDYLGDNKVIALYILGGIAGSISLLILFNLVPYFRDMSDGIGYGASAAMFAIMVAAATLVPDYTFNLLFIGPVKIKYIVLIEVFIALIGLKGYNVGGEVAHLFGAAAGYFYIKEFQKGNDIGIPILHALSFFKSFFVKQPTIKVTHKKERRRSAFGRAASKHASSITNQEEIDAILDKISKSGYESLSKVEKQKLFNASKK